MAVKTTMVLSRALFLVSTTWAQTSSASLAGTPPATWAVTNSVPATNEISFADFLNELVAANLDYAAQRYNVSIAQAAVAAAKEFQNPTLQLNGGRDVTHSGRERMPDTAGASL